MGNLAFKLAVQQLNALDDHIKLVAIHPNFTAQHLLMAELIEQDAVYVRFEGVKLKQADLQAQLEAALEAQIDSKDAAQAGLLLLDECDRAESKELDQFLVSLTETLGDSRSVIFSRYVPGVFINKHSLADQVAFVPVDQSFMLWDYANRGEENTLLEVHSFGEGRVLLNGRSIENWDGGLPRSLFFYLVDRGMVTRGEIFETFWPNLTVREATNVFHVTKRKISEVLGIDLTAYWSGFYRVSPKIDLSYDVVSFTDLVQQSGVLSGEAASDKLVRADLLYSGEFLSGMDMEWVKNRRAELAQDYSEALATLAKSREDSGHKQEALGLYLRAAAHDRQREDIATSIMNLYHELGMYADALIAYDRLSEGLKDQLGVAPAPYIQALATTIRHDMEQAAV